MRRMTLIFATCPRCKQEKALNSDGNFMKHWADSDKSIRCIYRGKPEKKED